MLSCQTILRPYHELKGNKLELPIFCWIAQNILVTTSYFLALVQAWRTLLGNKFIIKDAWHMCPEIYLFTISSIITDNRYLWFDTSGRNQKNSAHVWRTTYDPLYEDFKGPISICRLYFQVWDLHYKDRTVVRQSYFSNGNPIPVRRLYIENGPRIHKRANKHTHTHTHTYTQHTSYL